MRVVVHGFEIHNSIDKMSRLYFHKSYSFLSFAVKSFHTNVKFNCDCQSLSENHIKNVFGGGVGCIRSLEIRVLGIYSACPDDLMSSKQLPLTAPCISALPGFVSQLGSHHLVTGKSLSMDMATPNPKSMATCSQAPASI